MLRVIIGAFALLAVSACGNAGSKIPIEGVGGSDGSSCGQVCDTDGREDVVRHCDTFCGDVVCDLQGVEECAPSCDVCQTWDEAVAQDRRVCFTCANEAKAKAYKEGYDDGFTAGQDSVECSICPEPKCFVVKAEIVCRDRDTHRKCLSSWWNKICEIEKVLVPTECPADVDHDDQD